MIYDKVEFDELSRLIRRFAREYENHKRTIETPKNLYERDQSIEKLPASYETLRSAVREWFKRMGAVA